jgi:hypothetical protein
MELFIFIVNLLGTMVITFFIAVLLWKVWVAILSGKMPTTTTRKVDVWLSAVIFYPCAAYVICQLWGIL